MTSAATTALDDLAIDPETVGLFTRPDYFELLARLRAEAPLYRYADHRWVVSRYDDVRAVSKDPMSFCSGQGVLMNDPKRDGMDLPGSILHMDPPEHAPWRRVASRWFTPRAMASLHESTEAIVRRVLDELGPGDEIDLVDTVAAPIPVMVIAELLGVGDAGMADFRRWSDACIGSPDDDPTGDVAMANLVAVGELLEFLNDHVAARRSEASDDLLGALVAAEVDGRPLRDDEVVMYCLALLIAGNETTRNLISGAAAALFEHPDQRSRLATSPPGGAALADAVEESLRWVTPIQSFARTATVEVELAGQVVEPGDWLVLLYGSANRDESAFGPTAGSFDVTRPPNPAHLAFGFGEHLCLGASLARLEAQTFLAHFLERFPHYELTGEPTWTRSTLVRGYASLPAVLA